VNVSKANRQILGFIMRVARDFRDPFALKSLYVSLVRSKLEYASYVWMMSYQNSCIVRLEKGQEKFILYALRRLGWMNMNMLSSYESRCKLLNLDTLCRRREIPSVVFVRDVLCARIDLSSLLGMFALTANPHRTRSRVLLLERFHRTAYCAIQNFNNEIQCFDFCVS
jgi:hypothetical protein